jgi:hypothetical protein
MLFELSQIRKTKHFNESKRCFGCGLVKRRADERSTIDGSGTLKQIQQHELEDLVKLGNG